MKWYSFRSERHLFQVGPGYWEDPWFSGVWKLPPGGTFGSQVRLITVNFLKLFSVVVLLDMNRRFFKDISMLFLYAGTCVTYPTFFGDAFLLIKPWILGIWTWRVLIAKHHGWAISPHSELRRLNRFIRIHVSLNILIFTIRSGNGLWSNQYLFGRFFQYLHVGLWWLHPAIYTGVIYARFRFWMMS